MPANDNPYGTVYLQQSVYRVQEPLEGVYTANITVIRGYVQLQMSPFSFHSKGFELNFLYFFFLFVAFVAEVVTLDIWRSCTAPLRLTSLV